MIDLAGKSIDEYLDHIINILKKSYWIYGLIMGALLLILQIVEYRYAIRDLETSTVITLLAIIFMGLGIWFGSQMNFGRKENELEIGEKELSKRLELLKISGREYEVLQLISTGLSNQQIADQLFISVSTVKSHTSKLFEKLNAERRTHLIQKAKDLGVL